MRRQRLRIPHDYFDLLPTEEVLASEIIPGDIAKCHNNWGFVLSSRYDKYHIEYGQEISLMKAGTAYLPPSHKVKIIQRSLLNKEKVKELMDLYNEEEAELAVLRKEEQEEEKKRLRDMRDRLNRELGED